MTARQSARFHVPSAERHTGQRHLAIPCKAGLRHFALGVWQLALFMALCVAACPRPAAGVTNLKRGDPAPAATLPDLDGKSVALEASRGRVVIVVFGEFYHARTRQACEQIRAVLKDPRLSDQQIRWILIITQDAPAADLRAEAAKEPWLASAGGPAIILHDKDRRAIGAYEVAVLPSVVVIDTHGRVVHAAAGLVERFKDVVTDALLLATGKLSPEQFDLTLHPVTTTAPGEDTLRSERLARLADQLVRRGGATMEDLAAEKYAEAIRLDPQNLSARLGLGELSLRRRRLPEAEAQFRTVLRSEPESADAGIGLAFVQLLRGGSELDEAEATVRKVLARNPSQPRAHYLMGLIFEQRHKTEDAAASFRKAAELLLERAEGR
jgi:peroxiredoxin